MRARRAWLRAAPPSSARDSRSPICNCSGRMSFDSALPFGSLTDRAHFLRVSMLAVVAGSACHTPGTPRIDGVAGAPANPATPWTVPASARTPPPPAAPPAAPAATAALAADSATTAAVRFSLTDVVDLALKNNPTTRESWANAQAAANEYGSARGARYPTLNGSVNLAGSIHGIGVRRRRKRIERRDRYEWVEHARRRRGGRTDARADHARVLAVVPGVRHGRRAPRRSSRRSRTRSR